MSVVFSLECGSECCSFSSGSPEEDVHESGLPPDVGFVARQWSRSFARICARLPPEILEGSCSNLSHTPMGKPQSSPEILLSDGQAGTSYI